MASFSERKGLNPIRSIIQLDDVDEETRIALWNVIHTYLFDRIRSSERDNEDWQKTFLRRTWEFFGNAIDEFPYDEVTDIGFLTKQIVLKGFYGEVYDLIEFLVTCQAIDQRLRSALTLTLNSRLEKYLCGYRIVAGVVTDITADEEIESIETAFKSQDKFAPVKEHLRQALISLANREQPDFRNSIKESISAVESTARLVLNEPKPVLSDLLKRLEKDHNLHPALAQSYLKLYAYSSDASGIRHSLIDDPNLGLKEARFMLVSCSAFTNYLIAKLG